MQVGDLVKSKHNNFMLGIVLKRYEDGTGFLWKIKWNSKESDSSFERKENLEVINEGR